MMLAAEHRATRLEMGRVVVLTSQLVRDHLLLFSALSVITAIPSLVVRYEQSLLPADEPWSASYLTALVASFASINLLMAGVAKAVVLNRAVYFHSLQVCLAEIARDCFALAAMGIIASFVVVSTSIIAPASMIERLAVPRLALTLMLLIPGIFIAVFLSVVVPVRTIERRGFVATFTRSMELTRGYRWPIFGFLVVITLVAAAYEIIIYAAVGDPASIEFQGYTGVFLAYLVIADTILAVIAAAGTTIVYFQLRLIKDGVPPDVAAAEFD